MSGVMSSAFTFIEFFFLDSLTSKLHFYLSFL